MIELHVDQLPQPIGRVDEFGRTVELLATDVEGAWEPCPHCGSGKTLDVTADGAHERRCANCSYLLDIDPIDFRAEDGLKIDVTEDEIRVRGKVEDVYALDDSAIALPHLGSPNPVPLPMPAHAFAPSIAIPAVERGASLKLQHPVPAMGKSIQDLQRSFLAGARASEREVIKKVEEETMKMNEFMSSIDAGAGLAASIAGAFPVISRPLVFPTIDMTKEEEIDLRAYAELQASAESEETLGMIVERNAYLDGVRKRIDQSQEKK